MIFKINFIFKGKMVVPDENTPSNCQIDMEKVKKACQKRFSFHAEGNRPEDFEYEARVKKSKKDSAANLRASMRGANEAMEQRTARDIRGENSARNNIWNQIVILCAENLQRDISKSLFSVSEKSHLHDRSHSCHPVSCEDLRRHYDGGSEPRQTVGQNLRSQQGCVLLCDWSLEK